ncbi:hypothetical protein [Vibrio sp. D431a]|uniref:hypothetical protein n=1 Tax=Vibrio sp. D431a TaxID=2837388 RepID=UPI0025573381|nr:hypothetical protein [Vibrio sp. D431a]MDK9789797.1 hypothetical protein [Vibrio sp. D431a]
MKKLKTKCWVILLKKLDTGSTFGYCCAEKKFLTNRVTVYHDIRDTRYHHEKDLIGGLGLQDFIRNEILTSHWFDESKYDVFVARLNSKQCPIKVDFKKAIKKCNHRPHQRSSANYSMPFVVKSLDAK